MLHSLPTPFPFMAGLLGMDARLHPALGGTQWVGLTCSSHSTPSHVLWWRLCLCLAEGPPFSNLPKGT